MCHVLIIEDEPLIAFDLEDTLGEHGALSFTIADSQQGAISAARARKPDFILSDVKLIEGKGPLAVQAIYGELGPIPVIFLTATPQDCAPCAPPGEIIPKPFNRATLGAAFRRLAFPQ